MKSIDARLRALEELAPAPNVRFVANFRPDGSLVPLATGQVYGRRVALLPEPVGSADAWLKLFVEPHLRDAETARAAQEASIQRADQELKRLGGQPCGQH